MIINSFFKRNNTIIKNSTLNTAKNPVVELFYGRNESSRYVFTIDYRHIFNNFLMSDMKITDLSTLKHTLRMYNTSFFDYRLHTNTFLGYTRATSFDLILYNLDQAFDEGVGYDKNNVNVNAGRQVISHVPSNYYNATSTTLWNEDFAVDTSDIETIIYNQDGSFHIEFNDRLSIDEEDYLYSKIINIQHFETGRENLEMDITNHVNAVLEAMYEAYMLEDNDTINFIVENNNFCLGFIPQLEREADVDMNFVGFFSKYANSGYSPFVQSELTDFIRDDRSNFVEDTPNRLYFYAKKGVNYKNLPSHPIVRIVLDPDNLDETLMVFEGDQVKNPMEGIYYVEFDIESGKFEECDVIYDIWETIYNGKVIQIEQTFSVKNNMFLSNGAYLSEDTKNIVFFHKGIDRDERINRGDRRKIQILPRIKYTANQYDETSEIQYRIYAREGINEIPFIEYTSLHKVENGERFFFLDTMSFLPNTYFMDIKLVREGQTKIFKEYISFLIVSSPVFGKQNIKTDYRPKIKVSPNNGNGECDEEYIIDITDQDFESRPPEAVVKDDHYIIDITDQNFEAREEVENPNNLYIVDIMDKSLEETQRNIKNENFVDLSELDFNTSSENEDETTP